MSATSSVREPWVVARERLRDRGLRWTSQRQAVISVLAAAHGHVTGSELVDRCRRANPATTPSTVYRTLDVLEEVGLVRHGHGADGREEFHIRPEREHGHLYCESCNGRWEIRPEVARGFVDALRQSDDFAVDLSHITVVGRCASCVAAERP